MRVVLYGYYGYGNAGDEAVLGGLLHGLRTKGPAGAEYIVLSGNPGETRACHGAEARIRTLRQAIDAAKGAGAWIFGGGSLLQDVTGRLTLPYYLLVMSCVASRRVPVYFHAQGIGPLRRPLNRILTAVALRKVRRISVRDPESAAFLAELGIKRPDVHVGADAAWLLHDVLPAPRAEGGSWLGLAVRSWLRQDGWLTGLLGGLRRFARAYDVGVRIVPMDNARDVPLARHIAASLAGRGDVAGAGASYREKLSWIGGCDFVVAMRLHAGIFAALYGVPMLLLSYDPKVDALAKALACPVLPLDKLTENIVFAVLQQEWRRREAVRRHLAERVPVLKGMAEDDLAGLVTALTGSGPVRMESGGL